MGSDPAKAYPAHLPCFCRSRTSEHPSVLRDRIRPVLKNRARICVQEPGVASCRQVRDNKMGTVLEQQTPYQCDRCGAANIVAAPLVYQQGTHTYSNHFSHTTSQSASAQAAAPPRPRGYVRSVVIWGPIFLFLALWTFIGLGAVFQVHGISAYKVNLALIILFLCIASLAALVNSVRRVNRYNREVFPQLQRNWEHTYICRRCGNSQLILS